SSPGRRMQGGSGSRLRAGRFGTRPSSPECSSSTCSSPLSGSGCARLRGWRSSGRGGDGRRAVARASAAAWRRSTTRAPPLAGPEPRRAPRALCCIVTILVCVDATQRRKRGSEAAQGGRGEEASAPACEPAAEGGQLARPVPATGGVRRLPFSLALIDTCLKGLSTSAALWEDSPRMRYVHDFDEPCEEGRAL